MHVKGVGSKMRRIWNEKMQYRHIKFSCKGKKKGLDDVKRNEMLLNDSSNVKKKSVQ